MNKTGTILAGIVGILVIAGFVFYAGQSTTIINDPTTVTPAKSIDTAVNDTAISETRESSLPTVTTNNIVAPSDTTAVMSGNVTPNGAFTSYWYEYSASPNLDNRSSSPSQNIGSGFVSIPAPGYIVGLAKNTTYYFRLAAVNQNGKNFGKQYSFRTTEGNPPPVGSTPTIQTTAASGILRTTANINGEVTANKASTQYWFEYGKTTNLGNTSAFVSIGDGTTKIPASLTLTNLEPTTTYYFRINAQNQFGTKNGSTLNFKTSGPPGPTIPTVTTKDVTNIGTSTAKLHGSINPNGAQTTYWFEYSTDSQFSSTLMKSTEQKILTTGTVTVSVETTVNSLNSKKNIYVRLVAKNSIGTAIGERVNFRTK